MLPKNYHLPKEEWISFLKRKHVFMRETCPDCSTALFKRHTTTCDVMVCTICGEQRISCYCGGHNSWFSAWRGYWPGVLETILFGLSQREFFEFSDLFFVNPLHSIRTNILVIFDQDRVATKEQGKEFLNLARKNSSVITTAIASEKQGYNINLVSDIRKNIPDLIVAFSFNKQILRITDNVY